MEARDFQNNIIVLALLGQVFQKSEACGIVFTIPVL